MANMDESLISWNLPNFVSFVLFIAIIWVVIGTAGHLFIRAPAMKRAANSNGGVSAGIGSGEPSIDSSGASDGDDFLADDGDMEMAV